MTPHNVTFPPRESFTLWLWDVRDLAALLVFEGYGPRRLERASRETHIKLMNLLVNDPQPISYGTLGEYSIFNRTDHAECDSVPFGDVQVYGGNDHLIMTYNILDRTIKIEPCLRIGRWKKLEVHDRED